MRRILAVVFITITLLINIYGIDVGQNTVFAAERNNDMLEDLVLNINAEGAVLIEEESGRVLYEKNAYKKMYPASTTKILTALVAIENGDLDEVLTVGDEISLVEPRGSRAWLRVGERLRLSDLIAGLLLPSGNDAAYTIALNTGRRIANNPSLKRDEAINVFVNKMNERAREIGAEHSKFINPHGFHSRLHYSTPYDMALIAREAFKNDYFRSVVKTYSYEGVNLKNEGHRWVNTNKLLDRESQSYYKYATGIKTGHTIPAGYCLISSGSKDDMNVIAVVLNTSPSGQWEDSRILLDYGLNSFTHHVILNKGDVLKTIKVNNKLPWDNMGLALIAADGFEDIFHKGDIPNILLTIEWDNNLVRPSDNGKEEIEILSSLYKGEVLGRVIYTLNGDILKEIAIESGRDIRISYGIYKLPGFAYIYKNINIIFPLWIFLTAFLTVVIVKIMRGKKKGKV